MVQCMIAAVSVGLFESFDVFMTRGGAIMWTLLICSVVTLVAVIKRIYFYVNYKLMVRDGAQSYRKALESTRLGLFDEAESLADKSHSPFAKLLGDALKERMIDFDQALEESALELMHQMHRQLSLLDTIVTLAPLLGILGTVTGIITSFDMLGSMGVEDPTSVTGGIAEALLTTAGGLCVSIFALLPLNTFNAINRRHMQELEFVTHVIDVAYRKGYMALTASAPIVDASTQDPVHEENAANEASQSNETL